MSYCLREDSKDDVIFVTKDDHQQPSTVVLKEDDDDAPGLILSNGDINWECPCLGGMATGPCGNQFREAFSCFHFSEAEPKGSECFEAFRTMQECMSSYPELYGDDDDKQSDNEKQAAVEQALAQLDVDVGDIDKDTDTGDKDDVDDGETSSDKGDKGAMSENSEESSEKDEASEHETKSDNVNDAESKQINEKQIGDNKSS